MRGRWRATSSPAEDAARAARSSDPTQCKHFGACGGCAWLGVVYEDQRSRKQQITRDAFAAYPALANVAIEPAVAAPRPHFYRNRLLYPLASRRGRIEAGFFRRGTHDLVDVEECKIQDPAITEIARRLKRTIRELALPIAAMPGVESDPSRAAGGGAPGLRAIAVRLAPATGEALIGIVTTGGVLEGLDELARRARASASDLRSADGKQITVVGVVRNIQESDTNVVMGARSVPLLGKDTLDDRFLGFRIRVSLTSFFQPNAAASAEAFKDLARYATKNSAAKIIDAYAGIGVIALALAREGREIVAIEESRSAARDGKANTQQIRRGRVEFLEGRVEDRLPELASRGPADLLVLDPPRSGVSESSLASALAARPRRIAYLSCSATSLARDLDRLAAEYTIERVTPYDFLPQTDQVEVLAFLRRRDAKD